MVSIDINCDLGEGGGNDEKIMRYISSANIACGFHAGNINTIEKTILLASRYNVSIGAHPGYPDKENFGRKKMSLSPKEITALVKKQVSLLKLKTEENHQILQHIKPHGALYNQAATDIDIARAICKAIIEVDPRLVFMGMPNSAMQTASTEAGLNFCAEGFVDRAYTNQGLLVPRSTPGAVITDIETCKTRALQIAQTNTTTSIDNKKIDLIVNTICIHGDTENAIEIARSINEYLTTNNINIKATL